jgi:hypothetical protein
MPDTNNSDLGFSHKEPYGFHLKIQRDFTLG